MRPARRADPPHRPDHSKKPRSPLQSPSPDRLPDPSAGAQSFTHSDTDISLPPIASYPTPQLGSKMTKARTADSQQTVLDKNGLVTLSCDQHHEWKAMRGETTLEDEGNEAVFVED